MREYIASELATSVGIKTPALTVIPYHKKTNLKKARHFAIATEYIDHSPHTVSLNYIRSLEAYAQTLLQEPELCRIAAFDAILRNIDRRHANILKKPVSTTVNTWYAIDHEWMLSGYQPPSIHTLNLLCLMHLQDNDIDIHEFEPLQYQKINIDQKHLETSAKFEYMPFEYTLAIIQKLLRHMNELAPVLLDEARIKTLAQEAFAQAGEVVERSMNKLPVLIEDARINTHLLTRLYQTTCEVPF